MDLIEVTEAMVPGLTRRALYRMCRVGRLPGRKIGRRWYVTRDGFAAWLESTFAAPCDPAAAARADLAAAGYR